MRAVSQQRWSLDASTDGDTRDSRTTESDGRRAAVPAPVVESAEMLIGRDNINPWAARSGQSGFRPFWGWSVCRDRGQI